MMKVLQKTIHLVIGFLLMSLPVYAQDIQSPLVKSEEAFILSYTYLDTMFSLDPPDTEDEILRFCEIARIMEPAQRAALYNKHRYPTLLSIGLNVVTGGMGSILYDDNKIVGLLLQLASTSALGLVIWANATQDPDLDRILIVSSYGLSITSIVGGVVFPLLEGKKANYAVDRILK